jgi:poly-gamma-glutamate capsule biosynthesis protein CapA/YwtB (metallophosphatase superfamily)/glycosyltransferase involved in cell wall biosynthesis
MSERPLKILIVGSLPPPIGGTTILFEQLADTLGKRRGVVVEVVDTSAIRGRSLVGIVRALTVAFRILLAATRADIISSHVHLSSLHLTVPPALIASRLFGKPLVVRLFGGKSLRGIRGPRGAAVRWVVRRADLLLVETKRLVEEARADGIANCRWFSNSRPARDTPPPDGEGRSSCRRFVFVSHVRPTKGIGEIIEAAEGLDTDVTVDIYGPLMDGLSAETFAGLSRVFYRGVAEPREVPGILAEHDALLLPTYHWGEGYPGIVIESFSVGVPVVCTKWQALPEIVDETCGLLVNPRDAASLREAMCKLVADDQLFADLRAGAEERAARFSSDYWAERFVEYCHLLVGLPCGDWRNATEQHDSGDGGETVSIAFLGDVHLGERPALELGGRVRAVLAAADLVVANQESPITDLPVEVNGKIGLRSGTEAARVLRDAGIGAVSVANNHIFDCGLPGYLETRKLLDDAGVSAFGAGTDLDDAFRPGVIDENGVRVALIACASEVTEATVAGPDRHGCAPLDERLVIDRVRECASEFDAVVVLVHWGYCDYRLPAPRQATIASLLLESGATVVVGHHSHVVQGVSRLAGSLVAYSLGNLAFFPYSHRGREVRPSGESLRGAVLTLDIGKKGAVSCRVHHTELRAGVVRLDGSRERAVEFSRRCALVAPVSLEGNWRREVRARFIRRAFYWANPLHWRGLRKEQLAGGGIMMREMISKKS